MAPGGETFRFSPRFCENVLRHGSHEWLPYSKDEVHLKSSNTNLSFRKRVSEQKNSIPVGMLFSFGGDNRTRTCDLMRVKHAL